LLPCSGTNIELDARNLSDHDFIAAALQHWPRLLDDVRELARGAGNVMASAAPTRDDVTTQLQVPLDEVLRVFRFLEKLHGLMHQPMAYQDPRQVEAFVDASYLEIKDLYYKVVWNWLPVPAQVDIEAG